MFFETQIKKFTGFSCGEKKRNLIAAIEKFSN